MKSLILFFCFIPLIGIIFQEYFLNKYYTTDCIFEAYRKYISFFLSVVFQLFCCIGLLVYIIVILL